MNKQELSNAKKWATKTHNNEDSETRHKMCISSLSTQINQILIEEKRLLESYIRSLKDAQNHRKNCENSLIIMYREYENKIAKGE